MLFCFLLSLVISSCASVKVKEVQSARARAVNCELPVFQGTSEVSRSYDVVCEIKSKTASTLFSNRTPQAAIDKAKSAACGCGADAIIVVSSGRTDLRFFSWRRGIASVQGITYKNAAAATK